MRGDTWLGFKSKTQIVTKKKPWFMATSPLSCYTRKFNEHKKQLLHCKDFFFFSHSLWLLISGCTHSHLTGRLATKTANYSAKTDPPFHHSLSIRAYIHRGAAPSRVPRFHLSGSLKGTHVSVENLQGHSHTSHSRKHKAD